MKMTLKEIKDTCNSLEDFCAATGYSEWVINEGGGDVEVEMTIDQARSLGIVTHDNNSFVHTYNGLHT